jgi:mevalonate kinase
VLVAGLVGREGKGDPGRPAVSRGSGHGKLILCGEHAVVYGHPALAFAVDRGTTVEVAPRTGPTRITADHPDDRLADAVARVVPASGLDVSIRTDLPVGRGMGSSAALAVALVRALADGDLSADAAIERAMPVERAFHGNPSGLDVAVAAHGGMMRYLRGPPREIAPLKAPRWTVVVLDSGAAGNTAALVAGVAARRPAVDRALDRIGALVREAEAALEDVPALGALLDENHALLAEIGVSTPTLDALVALARRAGAAGAKLAGAGGGGVVLALVADPAPVLAAAGRAGVVAWPCRPAA